MQGRQPQQGQGVGQPDFGWLLGLAGGDNHLTQTVVAFAGGGAANATVMGAMNTQGTQQAALVEITTVVTAGDSCQLPQASAGKMLCVFNKTANASDIFANPNVNKATATTDTINALATATALSIAAGSRILFFCPKDGHWAAIVSA